MTAATETPIRRRRATKVQQLEAVRWGAEKAEDILKELRHMAIDEVEVQLRLDNLGVYARDRAKRLKKEMS